MSMAAIALALAAQATAADFAPNGQMIRNPDISSTHIVFSYADDLWLVPREGGSASPLASPAGAETNPRFSPDGQSIAFLGNYDGGRDLYTVAVDGGIPQRVSHHPGSEFLQDWLADGTLLYSMRGLDMPNFEQLFTVPATGGMFTRLPVPYGANATISADGRTLAYTLVDRDWRTWKRYMGGTATDIWLFDLQDKTSQMITDWGGTDTDPMWHNGKVYYVSDDGPSHRRNLWLYDPATGNRSQLTRHAEQDVRDPAIGDGRIVYQLGPELRVFNTATNGDAMVNVTIPGARATIREQEVDYARFIESFDVSPNGKRALLGARGDLWSLPASAGSTRNLSRTAGVAERYPAWSPDGRWIAYFADPTGEYELYVRQSDGRDEPRQLTSGNTTFFTGAGWSPDSEKLAITDKAGNLMLVDVETGETTRIARDVAASRPSFSFSHDSSWLAYDLSNGHFISTIWLYNIETGDNRQVTAGQFSSYAPAFDHEGDFLAFAVDHDYSSPISEDFGYTMIFAGTTRLAIVPLRDDVENPFLPEADVQTWDDEDEADEEAKDEDAKDEDEDGDKSDADENGDNGGEAKDDDAKDDEDEEEAEEPLEIDLEGFEARAIRLPVDAGNLGGPAWTDDGALMYPRSPGPGQNGTTNLMHFKPTWDEPEEKTIVSGITAAAPTADGSKVLVRNSSGRYAVVDAKPSQKMEDFVDTGAMKAKIDPRAEWEQVFNDMWRRYRDYFYDPNMHGVDWQGVREQYAAMLPDCVSRRDVSFVLREMISELNVGHAYYFETPDLERGSGASTGLIGVDFALENGAYRIARIPRPAAWDFADRSPVDQPGIDINEGDYILAVNGVPMDISKDPYAAFLNTAGDHVTLTVSENPEMDDEAREVLVKTVRSERTLRYRDWVERTRQYVDERTSGKVGYVHVPNTAFAGHIELFRGSYGQIGKEAMIIDERWNGGGFIPTRMIGLLNREREFYMATRDGHPQPWPYDGHHGPKAMLINRSAGSGGDCFPWLFKHHDLGPVIGTRTWGGLVGYGSVPGFIDGSGCAVPNWAFYENDGTWGVEGYGVDPTHPVMDDPALMLNGGDPQVDVAIDLMLEAIETNPRIDVPIPAYPNRAGMGITDEDR